VKIRWLPETRVDLDRIDSFWNSIDSSLGPRAAGVILGLAESLERFPDRGRISPVDPDTRELVGRFGDGAFILRYRVLGDDVLVVQVRHSKERP
jgi:plasmid stabilization system protein ParE